MCAGELDLIPGAEEGQGEGWSEDPASKGPRSTKAAWGSVCEAVPQA